MITARQNFRHAIDKQLGGAGLSAGARLRDALIARRCRNLFFSAMGPCVIGAASPNDIIVQAKTQPFGMPVIVTDILNFDEGYDAGFTPIVLPWQLMRVFTSGIGAQEDFFGAGNFFDSHFVLGHYQSNATLSTDAPSLKIHFAPYMMRVGEIFQVNWEYLDFNSLQAFTPRDQFNPEADFRGLQVLKEDDAYGQLCGKLQEQVCGYINRYDAEFFILDLEIPTAQFPATGVTAVFSTPLQERPLLVYGIGTNINGAQVTMRDNDANWEFCVAPKAPGQRILNGAPATANYGNIAGLPINVIAGNGDLTMHEAYNMFPVPHLLAPNTAIVFRLTNGLRSDGAGTFTQTMNTIANNNVSTGNGHIALLCRTV